MTHEISELYEAIEKLNLIKGVHFNREYKALLRLRFLKKSIRSRSERNLKLKKDLQEIIEILEGKKW